MESLDREEWAPVQPSAEDSVKVMTIHQAKGLEFDTVFVPGLATDLLPDMKIQQNPAERGYSLDFELRGDHRILPAFHGNLSQFRTALRAQEGIEERRTCYVGLTRARRRLFVTGAHWYGEGANAKRPSPFFDELAEWGEATGLAAVDRGPDVSEENPLVGYRERFVRDWPGPALRGEADDLFPRGWRRAAADSARNASTLANLVDGLDEEGRRVYEGAWTEHRSLAAHLMERETRTSEGPTLPT